MGAKQHDLLRIEKIRDLVGKSLNLLPQGHGLYHSKYVYPSNPFS
jgi:hypothetical protein